MSDDPVRWADAPDAPPGAFELVRSIGAAPPLPPGMRGVALRHVRSHARRRFAIPAVAVALAAVAAAAWALVPAREETPRAHIAPVDEPAPRATQPAPEAIAMQPLREPPEAQPLPEPLAMQPEPAERPAAVYEARRRPAPPAVVEQPPPAPAAAVEQARPPPPAPPAAPPADATGWLTVRSVPPARIFIDRRDTGLTTPASRIALPAGAHQLGLRSDDGRTLVTPVDIVAGEVRNVSLRFDDVVPHASAPGAAGPTGYLTINTMPWARVFVDGRDTGRTTPVLRMPLPAGRHTIGLRASDGSLHSVTVDIEPGEVMRIVRQLR